MSVGFFIYFVFKAGFALSQIKDIIRYRLNVGNNNWLLMIFFKIIVIFFPVNCQFPKLY